MVNRRQFFSYAAVIVALGSIVFLAVEYSAYSDSLAAKRVAEAKYEARYDKTAASAKTKSSAPPRVAAQTSAQPSAQPRVKKVPLGFGRPSTADLPVVFS